MARLPLYFFFLLVPCAAWADPIEAWEVIGPLPSPAPSEIAPPAADWLAGTDIAGPYQGLRRPERWRPVRAPRGIVELPDASIGTWYLRARVVVPEGALGLHVRATAAARIWWGDRLVGGWSARRGADRYAVAGGARRMLVELRPARETIGLHARLTQPDGRRVSVRVGGAVSNAAGRLAGPVAIEVVRGPTLEALPAAAEPPGPDVHVWPAPPAVRLDQPRWPGADREYLFDHRGLDHLSGWSWRDWAVRVNTPSAVAALKVVPLPDEGGRPAALTWHRADGRLRAPRLRRVGAGWRATMAELAVGDVIAVRVRAARPLGPVDIAWQAPTDGPVWSWSARIVLPRGAQPRARSSASGPVVDDPRPGARAWTWRAEAVAPGGAALRVGTAATPEAFAAAWLPFLRHRLRPGAADERSARGQSVDALIAAVRQTPAFPDAVERAATLVRLLRAVGRPARLIWVRAPGRGSSPVGPVVRADFDGVWVHDGERRIDPRPATPAATRCADGLSRSWVGPTGTGPARVPAPLRTTFAEYLPSLERLEQGWRVRHRVRWQRPTADRRAARRFCAHVDARARP